MIKNLKIALKRQKKLIFIFLLTIFLPSVSLSIFGIRAIRNERYRQAKQIENEQNRVIDYLKTQIMFHIKEVEFNLLNLVQYPPFTNKEYQTLTELLKNQLSNNPLVEHTFTIYKDEIPLFPLFQPIPGRDIKKTSIPLNNSQQEKLNKAEEYEFKQKKYKNAVSIYRELFVDLKEKNHQAQMQNKIARCFFKQKNYQQAIKNYLGIIRNFPKSRTLTELPLALLAKIQLIDCYLFAKDSLNALESALNLYQEIIQNPWKLSEDQFKTYAALITGTITGILSKNASNDSYAEHHQVFEQINTNHQDKVEQWDIMNIMKRECLPEIEKKLIQAEHYIPQPFYFSKSINNKNYLIAAVFIPDKENRNSKGILGINLKNSYLETDLLNNIIEDMHLEENTILTISDLSGQMVYDKKIPSEKFSSVTTFFENNFPP